MEYKHPLYQKIFFKIIFTSFRSRSIEIFLSGIWNRYGVFCFSCTSPVPTILIHISGQHTCSQIQYSLSFYAQVSFYHLVIEFLRVYIPKHGIIFPYSPPIKGFSCFIWSEIFPTNQKQISERPCNKVVDNSHNNRWYLKDQLAIPATKIMSIQTRI